MPFQGILEVIKLALVEISVEELKKISPKINPSRVSLMSGLHRKDVRRILKDEEPKDIERGGLLARVLSRWTSDREFCTTNGRPRTLSIKGIDSEFSKLVLKENTDYNPGTVLFELERVGAAIRTRNGLKLLQDSFMSPDNLDDGWAMLAHDVDLLVTAVTENLAEPKKLKNLHLRTEYDNVFVSEVPAIRKWLVQQGKSFHKRVREFLSERDKDLASEGDNRKAGAKISLGTFTLIE